MGIHALAPNEVRALSGSTGFSLDVVCRYLAGIYVQHRIANRLFAAIVALKGHEIALVISRGREKQAHSPDLGA